MKTAVLGAGKMGQTVIGHLAQIMDKEQIVAFDVDAATLVLVRSSHGVAETSDLRSILADPEIKVVFVTSPNETHKDLAIACLTAGKAVMCEKPMALTLADAREMVEAYERHHSFLQVGFELHYSSLYTRVKAWIDAGMLGTVVNSHCSYICSEFWGKRSWRIRHHAAGGMFGEKLSHYIDLQRWLTGDDVVQVISSCAPNVIPYFEVRDNYHTTCRYRRGAVGHLTFMMAPAATWEGDPLQDALALQKDDGHQLRLLVVGTRGAAEADVFNRSLKRWEFSDNDERLVSRIVEDLTWTPDEDHCQFHNTQDQTWDIVDRVRRGLPPRLAPRDSLETMRLCFAAEEAATTGKIVNVDASDNASPGGEPGSLRAIAITRPQ
jgi:predicted dehydrogenase